MRLLAASLLLAFAAPARGEASFEALAAASDHVVVGQVLQTGALDGTPATTIAIDRQLRGVLPAGAVTFQATGWRVGERSAFFLRRLPRGGRGPRFASIAAPAASLAASEGLLHTEPVRAAAYRREPPASQEGGVSLPGIAAGSSQRWGSWRSRGAAGSR
ncbi:MAG TPA: hypothetical protein VN033_04430 [Vulgatibacter sp.]|nr:hypothetical protein [Vulgatibacter sp.]